MISRLTTPPPFPPEGVVGVAVAAPTVGVLVGIYVACEGEVGVGVAVGLIVGVEVGDPPPPQAVTNTSKSVKVARDYWDPSFHETDLLKLLYTK